MLSKKTLLLTAVAACGGAYIGAKLERALRLMRPTPHGAVFIIQRGEEEPSQFDNQGKEPSDEEIMDRMEEVPVIPPEDDDDDEPPIFSGCDSIADADDFDTEFERAKEKAFQSGYTHGRTVGYEKGMNDGYNKAMADFRINEEAEDPDEATKIPLDEAIMEEIYSMSEGEQEDDAPVEPAKEAEPAPEEPVTEKKPKNTGNKPKNTGKKKSPEKPKTEKKEA